MIRRGAIAVALFVAVSATASAHACDPPGPPPRFGCFWSTDSCEWLCAVCDPYGSPPRSSCGWDMQVCNWICPGYTGTDVTVTTTHAPTHVATVYVNLMSLCRSTGAGASCGGSFAVSSALSVSQKCQALAGTVAADCASAGYAVTANDCASRGSFTISNAGCPDTQFALGISNDANDFDQADQPSLPDGESESIQGSCHPVPGAVSHLRIDKVSGGSQLQLTWDPAQNAAAYTAYDDSAPSGSFGDAIGTTTSPSLGVTVAMPAGVEFYLVAGRNATCGDGSKK